jgi:hypothetical protein
MRATRADGDQHLQWDRQAVMWMTVEDRDQTR